MRSKSTSDFSSQPPALQRDLEIPLRVIELDAEYFRPSGRSVKFPREGWRRFWPWFCFIVCSIISYFLVSQFIVTTVVVQGRSMAPTLVDGDRYLLHKWELLFRAPKRGDLVVIRDSRRKDYMVKRVVALPGERVQIRDGAVFVNGERLSEPYLRAETRTLTVDGTEPLLIVGKDRYFVMGDNRGLSEDSRVYGPVQRERILGYIPQE
ncbi:MAG: signal peptidase I [Verrucomicrobia subdivision 3 bacterium]|nr:signal peptidase I [Limisphaerales bacterium]